MSGPGDTPEKPDPASDPAPGPARDRANDAAEKNLTVTPAKVAHASTRSDRAAIPATPGDTGEPMDLKGAEVPAKPAGAATKVEASHAVKADAETAPKAPEAPRDKSPKSPPRRRGVIAWFLAGLGLAIAALAGLASRNVWSDPHYVISPRLDAVMQDFGGYVAAATLLGLALIAAALLRGRAAFVTTAFMLILAAVVVAFTTVLLGVGAAIMCGREPVFTQGAPDRRLVVIAVRGRCGVTREFTYRVSVRELGPSVPRQTMIFQSFGRPAPSEVVFTKDRTISVLIKSNNAEAAPRYTVTIDRKTFKPDKVWRFDVRTD
ncbi:MAG TPA: hypothetical protein VM325_08390 [Alphaproteobacteria bacterium]|nr:hypothetical protein [Alphaproteobacteria bacterium]